MKANEVLKTLRITRVTLHNYVKKGIIRVRKLPNGYYDYLDEDVYKFLNKDVERKTYIYARVSTRKQKKDLISQIDMLKNWAFQNGYEINGIYQDIASGISFEKRNDFFKLLDEVINYKVDKVIIAYKDRLSRIGFELFYHLFKKFGTEIIVVSEVGSKKLDAEEIFEEIVSLLLCYSMKLYSKRRNNTLEVSINESNQDRANLD
jgi:predicted site-specific integrase-resolvase